MHQWSHRLHMGQIPGTGFVRIPLTFGGFHSGTVLPFAFTGRKPNIVSRHPFARQFVRHWQFCRYQYFLFQFRRNARAARVALSITVTTIPTQRDKKGHGHDFFLGPCVPLNMPPRTFLVVRQHCHTSPFPFPIGVIPFGFSLQAVPTLHRQCVFTGDTRVKPLQWQKHGFLHLLKCFRYLQMCIQHTRLVLFLLVRRHATATTFRLKLKTAGCTVLICTVHTRTVATTAAIATVVTTTDRHMCQSSQSSWLPLPGF